MWQDQFAPDVLPEQISSSSIDWRRHAAAGPEVDGREGAAAAHARALATAFGLIELPAAVLSSSHHLIAANNQLRGLIPAVLTERRERVALTDLVADKLLLQAFTSLSRADGDDYRQIVPIKERESHPAMLAHLIRTGQHLCLGSEISWFLIISPLAAQVRPAKQEALKALFGLTPAEAKIACAIAGGSTVEKLASELQRSCGTIRVQLKSVFAKTGTHRQSQLAALLTGLASRP